MLAVLALGSNLPSRYGEPAANLVEALHRLHELGTLTAVSSFHLTDPVGLLDQPRFVNAAALLHTDLRPLELLRALLAIEAGMGRLRGTDQPPKGPRVLDLDLLFCEYESLDVEYGNLKTEVEDREDGHNHSLILADPELTLPHPSLHERRFVLAPLAEIAPRLVHPGLHRTVAELLAGLAEEQP